MPLAGDLVRMAALGVRFANALLEWLLTYAIHSTILIGGLLLLTAIPSVRSLLNGHGSWLWRFALVGGLVTASLQSLRTASPLTGTFRLDGDTPSRTLVRLEVTQADAPAPTGSAAVGKLDWRSTDGAQRVIKSDIEVTPGWPLVALVKRERVP